MILGKHNLSVFLFSLLLLLSLCVTIPWWGLKILRKHPSLQIPHHSLTGESLPEPPSWALGEVGGSASVSPTLPEGSVHQRLRLFPYSHPHAQSLGPYLLVAVHEEETSLDFCLLLRK